jgi:hypothetical protein
MNQAELIDHIEVLKMLNLSPDGFLAPRKLVMRLYRSGKVNGVRIGGKTMFFADSVREYLRKTCASPPTPPRRIRKRRKDLKGMA